MKHVALTITGSILLSVIAGNTWSAGPVSQPVLATASGHILTEAGRRSRDLNRNGRLDPYEDWRLSPEQRARDLLQRMTLEEKAGLMLHGTLRATDSPLGSSTKGYDFGAVGKLISERHINTFITRLSVSPEEFARQNNRVQEIAAGTRLGVPVTISTDPRNHFQYLLGASTAPVAFSQWPEPLGLAAIGDAGLVRRFADIARQEYRAVGITEALSPQADLATEPRWPRINGTFGEDAELASRLVQAYIEGFQNGASGLNPDSVACVVKHWVGYGAAQNGFDSHNSYGRYASFPGGNFRYHLKPFEGAFAAHVAAVMPMYSIPAGLVLNGTTVEQVGGAFNSVLLQGLLRGSYGFQGVVLSDWAVTNDCNQECLHGAPPGQEPSVAGIATSWGVTELAAVDRFAKAVNAGVDQIGGTEDLDTLLEAIHSGKIAETRLDVAALRILEQKFALGLFERPFVDPARAGRIVGAAQFALEARAAQQRAVVLLENKNDVLPIGAGTRVFLHGVAAEIARAHGLSIVADPAQAELAIIRVSAPFESLHPQYFFGKRQHEGRLEFRDGDADYELVKRVSAQVPTIVTVYLDRPAVLTNLRDKVRALSVNFGISDDALLEVLMGRAAAGGRLPVELPSSMQAVEAQMPDVPHDSREPLYPIFYGIEMRRRMGGGGSTTGTGS